MKNKFFSLHGTRQITGRSLPRRFLHQRARLTSTKSNLHVRHRYPPFPRPPAAVPTRARAVSLVDRRPVALSGGRAPHRVPWDTLRKRPASISVSHAY